MKDLDDDEDLDREPVLGDDDCLADMLVSAALANNAGLEEGVQMARDALPRDVDEEDEEDDE